MAKRAEGTTPRIAAFEIGDETFVLRGQQIDALWERLAPSASWDEKVSELAAVQNEVEP